MPASAVYIFYDWFVMCSKQTLGTLCRWENLEGTGVGIEPVHFPAVCLVVVRVAALSLLVYAGFNRCVSN